MPDGFIPQSRLPAGPKSLPCSRSTLGSVGESPNRFLQITANAALPVLRSSNVDQNLLEWATWPDVAN
jgi:hypothetical protein